MGGSVTAIEQGFIQEEIARSAYEYQRKIETGEKIIVGVNKFQVKEEQTIPVFWIDDQIRDHQIQKLKNLKEKREKEKASNSLNNIRQKAISGENLIPSV